MNNGFLVRENTCPTCNYVSNAAGMADGTPAMPEPGDISVCINCGEILQFGCSMKLQNMSKSQMNQFQSENPEAYLEAIKAQQVIRGMGRRGKRP